MANTRLGFLDVCRGVAATVVVVQHTGEVLFPGFEEFSHHTLNVGRFGVMVFFLVSGFVIPISIERTGAATRGATVRSFWIGRCFRLYPMYWVSLAAVLALSVVDSAALSPEFREHTVLNALANVTMTQELLGRPHAIGLYYTLTLELVFYVLCSALHLAGGLHRSVRNAWCALGVCVVGTVVPFALGHRVPFAACFYLASMFIGTVVARAAAGTVRARDVGWLVGAAAVVAAAGGWVNYSRYPSSDAMEALSFSAAVSGWVLAYGFFFAVVAFRRRDWPPRVLVEVGLFSYSLYLLHPLFVIVVRDWSHAWLGAAVVAVASFAIAPVTYRLVELPCQRVGRRIRARLTG